MLETLLISCAAGVVGTGTGGLIGLFLGESSKQSMSYLLSFASGVMVSVVCFDLIPESLELASLSVVVVSIILGAVIVQFLNALIDRFSHTPETHVELEELHHQEEILNPQRKQSMLMSGLVMFAAISLHNLPEGMAIGSGASHDAQMGLTLAALIALHNIPEGMSIGVPLIAGGMNKWKAVLLTALSGAPTLVGGALGAFLGSGGDALVAISLALAAGAMLYVTYCEILPQVILLNQGRGPAVFTIMGIILGLLMVYAL